MILLIIIISFSIISYNVLYITKTSINLMDLFENYSDIKKIFFIPFNRKKIDSPINIRARQYIWYKLYEKLSTKKQLSSNIQPIIKNFIDKLSGEIPILLDETGHILNIPTCFTHI